MLLNRRSLLALPLLLGLAACSVGDDYKRPETPAPAAWSEEEAKAVWPAADWWTAFGSDELNGYMQDAQTANLDIAAAIARIREADAQAEVSGAALLPTLDAGVSAARKQTPVSTTSSSSSSASKRPVIANSFSPTISASYELDFWGKNAATRDSAVAAATANRYDRQTVALTTQASVADTYFAILGLRDRLSVAQQNLVNAEEVLQAVQDRFAAGTVTELDVAQQEAEVASVRATIPGIEESLSQDVTALALLLGRLPQEVAPKGQPLASLTIPKVAPGLPSELLARRPDVLYAEQQLVGANADITVARAAFFPSLSLTAEYGFESAMLKTLTKSTSILWSVGSSLTQPIFHGGALEGAEDYRKARYDELVTTYRKAVLSAFIDVENALVAVKKTAEQEAAQKIYRDTSAKAYQIALEQLKGGIADITTALNTQKTLFSAEDSLAQARLAHLQAVVSLYKALGGGWDGSLEKPAKKE